MIKTIGNEHETKNYYYSKDLAIKDGFPPKFDHFTNADNNFSKPRLLSKQIAFFLKVFSFNSSDKEQEAKKLAFQLTQKFESQGHHSMQLSDDGIISYGLHQATLRSGSLEEIIKEYCSHSASTTSKKLAQYSEQIKLKDPNLKNNRQFLALLTEAALENEMKTAQDKIFTKDYWQPSYKKAVELNLKSPIAAAIFYDTKIQGGLEQVISKTQTRLLNKTYSEKEFLIAFLSERRKYLLNIAQQKSPAQARMLENSAYNRVGYLMKLVERSLVASSL